MKIYKFKDLERQANKTCSAAASTSDIQIVLLNRIACALDSLYALERDKVMERLSKDPTSHFNPETGMEVNFYE